MNSRQVKEVNKITTSVIKNFHVKFSENARVLEFRLSQSEVDRLIAQLKEAKKDGPVLNAGGR